MPTEFPVLWIVLIETGVFFWKCVAPSICHPDIIAMMMKIMPFIIIYRNKMFIAKDEINMHYYWYDSQLTGLFNSDSHAFIATRLRESSHTKRVRRHNADYTAAYPMNISQCSPANMIQAFIMQLNRSRRLFLFALFRLIEWYLYNEMKRSNEKKLHTPHLMHFCHVKHLHSKYWQCFGNCSAAMRIFCLSFDHFHLQVNVYECA